MVRIKHRYIVVKINVDGRGDNVRLRLKPSAFYETVLGKVQQLHGDYGVGAIKNGFATKYCNEITRIALVKVRHEPHKILIDTLPSVRTIDGKPVTLKIVYVGATMKQCFKFINRYQFGHLLKAWSTLRTDAERDAFKEAVFDFNSADRSDILVQ